MLYVPYTGKDVWVYVIDTGVDLVPELDTRVIARQTYGQDGTVNDCTSGTDFGHGTAVASTIAGSQNGVAKEALIVSLKAWNCNGVSLTSLIVDALNAAIVDHNWRKDAAVGGRPLSVANISMTAGGIHNLLDNTVLEAVRAGITVVIGAGNEAHLTEPAGAWNACNYSPGNTGTFDGVITVAASTRTDARRFDSNYGVCVDVFAPGDALTAASSKKGATYLEGPVDRPDRTDWSGTSAAAPHVAGVAALHLDQFNKTFPGTTMLCPANIEFHIIEGATANAIGNVGSTDTPNLLLHSKRMGAYPTTRQRSVRPNGWEPPC